MPSKDWTCIADMVSTNFDSVDHSDGSEEKIIEDTMRAINGSIKNVANLIHDKDGGPSLDTTALSLALLSLYKEVRIFAVMGGKSLRSALVKVIDVAFVAGIAYAVEKELR